MRLRLLVNAAVAALAAAVYVLFLFLLLNPGLASRPGAVAELLFGAGLVHAAALALCAAGLYLGYGWIARRSLPRRWLQWRYWGSFFAVYAVGVVGAYALNARFYRHLLAPPALERLLQAGVTVLAVSLGVAVAVAIRPLARRWPVRAAALALVWGSWGLLAGLSAGARPGPEPRPGTELEAVAPNRALRIVGIDGLSSDFILPLVGEGSLPGFARLMKEGAYGSLRSFPPGDEDTLWSTVMTGQKPHRHGVRGPLRYRLAWSGEPLALAPRGVGFSVLRTLGLVRSEPTSPGHLAARALWDLLSDFNVRSTFVGFPLLDGNRALPGVQVRPLGAASGPAPGGLAEWMARMVEASSEPDEAQDAILRIGLGIDLAAIDATAALAGGGAPPQVAALRLAGFDHVAHHFLRYHRPEEFGNVTPRGLERYGGSLAEYLRFLDEQVTRERQSLPKRGVLLVVSPHGILPVPPMGRLVQHLRGTPPLSGQHRSGPPGFFFLQGMGVQAAQKIDSARLVDILPTLLYFLGLPVARDLDGEPLTQVFTPAFLEAHPISSIPTYEGASIEEGEAAPLAEPEPPLP